MGNLKVSQNVINQIKYLRMQDPELWTVRALAKKFHVSKSFVGAIINAFSPDHEFKRRSAKCRIHNRILEESGRCPACWEIEKREKGILDE